MFPELSDTVAYGRIVEYAEEPSSRVDTARAW
jgi:hypothetical protein